MNCDNQCCENKHDHHKHDGGKYGINVNTLVHTNELLLVEQAAELVPVDMRKPGTKITFWTYSGWETWQFVSKDVKEWVLPEHWKQESVYGMDNINDLQNQIDSIQIGGWAISQEFGDDEHIGISQKKLTEEFNKTATLDSNGKVPSYQLPSYVDDVVEGYYYDNAFYVDENHTQLLEAETGKIYVDVPSKVSYRYSGSAYIAISNPYMPDEEDTTVTNDKIKFKDKTYNASAYSGLGRKYLRKNMVNSVNTLTQAMVNAANTIYVIQYDYVLGETITIPDGCVLQFEGGSFSDGTLKGKFPINDVKYQIFYNIEFVKNETVLVVDYIRPEWYGAKGNYNRNDLSLSSDDSSAITVAIRQANVSGVNKVKFSACQYYINSGITVTSGDIVLEGVSGELREDLKFNGVNNDVNYYKYSSLVAGSECSSVITFGSTVTHPVLIKNINFMQYDIYTRNPFDAIGILFESDFTGPTWPFIIDYCHFYGFDKAIMFKNDSLNYLVYDVRITHCGFSYNTFCVYFNDDITSYDANTIIGNNTWSFTFRYNKAHSNTFVLYTTSAVDSCTVEYNNFEGDLAKLPNGDNIPSRYSDMPVSCIKLIDYAKLSFKYNHFEQSNKKPLRIVSNNKGAYLDISRNFYNPTSTISEIELYGLNDYTTAGMRAGFRIENIDVNKVSLMNALAIYTETLKDIYYVKSNAVVAFFCNKIEESVGNLTAVTNAKTYYGNTNIRFINGKIYRERIDSADRYVIQPYTISDGSNNNYMIAWSESIVQNTALQRVSVGYGSRYAECSLIKNYKYSIGILNLEAADSNSVYFIRHKQAAQTNDYITGTCGAIIIQNDNEISASRLLGNIEYNNRLTKADLADVVYVNVGDRCFITDLNKEAIYNGTKWVDATGADIIE